MSRRILLFTGKGGVGKTTTAAATALQLAAQGHKTLIMSVDPAHSLSDALDRPLGPEPTEVSENLFAMELDVYYSMKKHWENIRTLMLTAFKWQGVSSIQAEELAALPGMEEASAFLWLEQFYQDKSFDTIVVDSAPTGETLAFLTLPQVTNWWMQKAFPGQRYALRVKVPSFQGLNLATQQFGDTLVIQADSRRRNIILPRFLGYYRVVGSSLEGDWLTVTFAAAD